MCEQMCMFIELIFFFFKTAQNYLFSSHRSQVPKLWFSQSYFLATPVQILEKFIRKKELFLYFRLKTFFEELYVDGKGTPGSSSSSPTDKSDYESIFSL